jgi:hypothetical protein
VNLCTPRPARILLHRSQGLSATHASHAACLSRTQFSHGGPPMQRVLVLRQDWHAVRARVRTATQNCTDPGTWLILLNSFHRLCLPRCLHTINLSLAGTKYSYLTAGGQFLPTRACIPSLPWWRRAQILVCTQHGNLSDTMTRIGQKMRWTYNSTYDTSGPKKY